MLKRKNSIKLVQVINLVTDTAISIRKGNYSIKWTHWFLLLTSDGSYWFPDMFIVSRRVKISMTSTKKLTNLLGNRTHIGSNQGIQNHPI